MTYKLVITDSQTIDFLDESGRSVASFTAAVDGPLKLTRADGALRQSTINVMEIAALIELGRLKAV